MSRAVPTAVAVSSVLAAGCSFATIRMPQTTDPPPRDPHAIHCNESALIPSLDALVGAAALAGMGAGIVLEHTSEDGKPEHFTAYYALPALAVAIVFFSAASFGSSRVQRCQELKGTAIEVRPITPLDPAHDPNLDPEQPPTR